MARKKQTKQRKQIKRQTRKFQLRVDHPIDQHVGEILDYKRSQRSEVTTIRDSVRLFWALENDDLEVLFEMFPKYRAKFTSGGDGAGGSDLAKQIAEQIVLMNGTPGYLMQSAQPSPAMPPKAGNLPAVPVAIAVKSAPPDADTMADNFLGMLSMFD